MAVAYVAASPGFFSGDGVYCADGFIGYECDPDPTLPNLPAPVADGGVLGLTAGYDWQDGNLVYGVAIDALFGNLFGSAPTSGGYSCAPRCNLEVNGTGIVRGRIGYASGAGLMPYLTAGLAISDISVQASAMDAPADHTVRNAVVGIGGEFQLSDTINVGMEYLHFLESEEDFLAGNAICPICGMTNFSADVIRLSVGYRF